MKIWWKQGGLWASTLHPYKGAVPVQALPTKVHGQKARYTHKPERDSKWSEADWGLDCTEWGPGRAGHGLRSRLHSGPLPPLHCPLQIEHCVAHLVWFKEASLKAIWTSLQPALKIEVNLAHITDMISANAQNHVLALPYIALLSRICPDLDFKDKYQLYDKLSQTRLQLLTTWSNLNLKPFLWETSMWIAICNLLQLTCKQTLEGLLLRSTADHTVPRYLSLGNWLNRSQSWNVREI